MHMAIYVSVCVSLYVCLFVCVLFVLATCKYVVFVYCHPPLRG